MAAGACLRLLSFSFPLALLTTHYHPNCKRGHPYILLQHVRAKSPLVGFSPGFTHVIQQQVFYCRRQLPKNICVKYSVLKCTKNRDVCLSLPSGFFQMDLTIHCGILEIQGPALRIRVSRLHVSA